MAAFFFCPGSLSLKAQKIKQNAKSKPSKPTPTVLHVDPLYETIPANETRFSEENRGRNTFKSTGQIPQPIQNLPKEMAIVTIRHTPLDPHSQEIPVYEGQNVLVIKQTTYWTYILDEYNQMGYVPTSHLSIATASSNTSSLPASAADTRATPIKEYSHTNFTPSESPNSFFTPEELNRIQTRFNDFQKYECHPQQTQSSIEINNTSANYNNFNKFRKETLETRVLTYNFRAAQENDLTVRKGEKVIVLNNSDSDWLWVMRGDGNEGFIPVAFTSLYSRPNPGTNSGARSLRHSKQSNSTQSTGYGSLPSNSTSTNHHSSFSTDQCRVTPEHLTRTASRDPRFDKEQYLLHTNSEPMLHPNVIPHVRRSNDMLPSPPPRSFTPPKFVCAPSESHNNTDSIDHMNSNCNKQAMIQQQQLMRSLSIQNRQENSTRHNPSNVSSYLMPQNRKDMRSSTRPVLPDYKEIISSPPEYHLINKNSHLKNNSNSNNNNSNNVDSNNNQNNHIYENGQKFIKNSEHCGQSYPIENIYMNTIQLDSNGKPSLVPSIMTMQDRIQLLDKNISSLPPSPTSGSSAYQSSSLGDYTSISDYNQNDRGFSYSQNYTSKRQENAV